MGGKMWLNFFILLTLSLVEGEIVKSSSFEDENTTRKLDEDSTILPAESFRSGSDGFSISRVINVESPGFNKKKSEDLTDFSSSPSVGFSQDGEDERIGIKSEVSVGAVNLGIKIIHPPQPLQGAQEAEEEEMGNLLVLRLAQCRATCLLKENRGNSTFNSSLLHPSFKECWETCKELEFDDDEEKKKLICESNLNCGFGCKEACEFHNGHLNESEKKNEAVKIEGKLRVSSGSPRVLEWGCGDCAEGDESLVYSLVEHSGTSWKLIGQTSKEEMELERMGKNLSNFRLLASNSNGIVKVFAFPDFQPNSKSANEKTATEKVKETTEGTQEKILWNLRQVSMVHQKFLVVTEVTWDVEWIPAETPKEKRNFLLTWEIFGGVVKGNLVTDTNSVSISLWPDTPYIIQVSLIDESEFPLTAEKLLAEGHPKLKAVSESLFLNTSFTSFPSSSSKLSLGSEERGSGMSGRKEETCGGFFTRLAGSLKTKDFYLIIFYWIFLAITFSTLLVYFSVKSMISRVTIAAARNSFVHLKPMLKNVLGRKSKNPPAKDWLIEGGILSREEKKKNRHDLQVTFNLEEVENENNLHGTVC